MSCAKPAEPIKIPLVVWTLEGQSNHVLSGSPDPPGEGPILGSSAETAGPIEMPFGVWTWVASKNHVFSGGQTPSGERSNFGGEGDTRRCGRSSEFFDHLFPPARLTRPVSSRGCRAARRGRCSANRDWPPPRDHVTRRAVTSRDPGRRRRDRATAAAARRRTPGGCLRDCAT